jgi:catechol 2,3-dioxygenase-like lactoylglutathione lyase family enzyme
MPTAQENLNLSPQTAATALPSPRISEIVLRTPNFETMRSWYRAVLSAEPSFEYDVPGGGPHGPGRAVDFHRLCFLRVFSEFPYTQVLALFELPELQKVSTRAAGLHHMQFRHASLDDWADRYEYLAAMGTIPYQSFNHGPSMSCYYEDPDGNLVEISGPNYSSDAEYRAFFASPGFARNPAGVEVDIAQFVARLRAGEDRRALVALPDA